ncbi:MAG: RidA family protein [Planctomycetota bacterium]
MTRTNLSTHGPFERTVGYSRAVVVEHAGLRRVFVAGTCAIGDDGETVAPNDAFGQTAYILRKLEPVLAEAGCSFADVVRTRMYVTSIADQEAVGRAHGEVFKDIRPAATMIGGIQLVRPDLVVEIELEAAKAE